MQVIEILLWDVLMRHSAQNLHNLGDDGMLGLLGDGFCLPALEIGEGRGIRLLLVFHRTFFGNEMTVAEVSDEGDMLVPSEFLQISFLQWGGGDDEV